MHQDRQRNTRTGLVWYSWKRRLSTMQPLPRHGSSFSQLSRMRVRFCDSLLRDFVTLRISMSSSLCFFLHAALIVVLGATTEECVERGVRNNVACNRKVFVCAFLRVCACLCVHVWVWLCNASVVCTWPSLAACVPRPSLGARSGLVGGRKHKASRLNSVMVRI